jgi:hypothetical protein
MRTLTSLLATAALVGGATIASAQQSGSRSAVRSNGWRQFAQRHPGRERNTADRNYRPGHEEGCEEGCAASAEGVRKPHSAVRTRGRRRPTSALIF